jgi:hypothetical protein
MLAHQTHNLICGFSPNQKTAICPEILTTQLFVLFLDHYHRPFPHERKSYGWEKTSKNLGEILFIRILNGRLLIS